MRFAIFTHVEHTLHNHKYYGYGPYVKEMNIWLKYVDQVDVVGPLVKQEPDVIDLNYEHSQINFFKIPSFHLTNGIAFFKSFIVMPFILFKVFRVMYKADHIHLRCPGNIGLLASFVQILFPYKKKTAKYAGNWDPKAKQPWTYNLQKWILSNTFLTRNMQVLVYGEWPSQTKNIKPFFTATYSTNEFTAPIVERKLGSKIKFLFVGTLSSGKRPIYAVKLVESLNSKGFNVSLDILGEGKKREVIVNYCDEKNINDIITLHGNKTSEEVKKWYLESDFVILPSKSEGWPKVVAEAMFWGCVPLATPVSCVPYMLDKGKRGLLLAVELNNDIESIQDIMVNHENYNEKSRNAMQWSRKFTTDFFESEIVNLLR